MSGAGSVLAGRPMVITAGGTREPIDPVRFLGNRSSGRMGLALAAEAVRRGAVVTLITTVEGEMPAALGVVMVQTAEEMHVAVRAALTPDAVLVMAAAVADYRPRTVAARKLKKIAAALTLELVPTVDILRSLHSDATARVALVVGFAAETDDLERNAHRKLEEKGVDLIVLNDVGRSDIGMNSDHNEVTIIGRAGFRRHVSRRLKTEVATAILDAVEAQLAG